MVNEILVVNGGSSTVKCTVYHNTIDLQPLLDIHINSSSQHHRALQYHNYVTEETGNYEIDYPKTSAARLIINVIKKSGLGLAISAIGYRVVFGMNYVHPEIITPALLTELKDMSRYDAEHMPQIVSMIEEFQQIFQNAIHVACFDSAFHSTLPTVAKWLPIPRKYNMKGIRRYGFHGLSYSYLMDELRNELSPKKIPERIIIAHLGNGASLAAIKNGISVDTTMGFSPSSGIPMSTRSGDLDPAVISAIIQSDDLDLKQFSQLINRESGLLGISETTGNIQQLVLTEHTDQRAADAVELFCYNVKKTIGAYAAVLGGVDMLIFSGGIGENIPVIRERICNELNFLRIELDHTRNVNNAKIISFDNAPVAIRVMTTNEQVVIARLVCQTINYSTKY